MRIAIPAKLKKHIPALIAVLIFLGSTAAGIYAYGAILDREQAVASRFPEIVPGPHRFDLRNDQDCFGYLNLEVPQNIESFPKISYRGKLSLQYKGRLLPVTVDGDISFNSLGQLGGSILSFTVDGAKLHLATLDINPIRVIMKLIKDGQIYRYQLMLPGPVVLQSTAAGNYRLHYPGLVNIETGKMEGLISNLLKVMKASISVVRVEEGEQQCSGDRLETFDITAYIIGLEQFISSAEMLLG